MVDPEKPPVRAERILRWIFPIAPIVGVLLGPERLGLTLAWVMSACTLFVLGGAGFLAWRGYKAPRLK